MQSEQLLHHHWFAWRNTSLPISGRWTVEMWPKRGLHCICCHIAIIWLVLMFIVELLRPSINCDQLAMFKSQLIAVTRTSACLLRNDVTLMWLKCINYGPGRRVLIAIAHSLHFTVVMSGKCDQCGSRWEGMRWATAAHGSVQLCIPIRRRFCSPSITCIIKSKVK